MRSFSFWLIWGVCCSVFVNGDDIKSGKEKVEKKGTSSDDEMSSERMKKMLKYAEERATNAEKEVKTLKGNYEKCRQDIVVLDEERKAESSSNSKTIEKLRTEYNEVEKKRSICERDFKMKEGQIEVQAAIVMNQEEKNMKCEADKKAIQKECGKCKKPGDEEEKNPQYEQCVKVLTRTKQQLDNYKAAAKIEEEKKKTASSSSSSSSSDFSFESVGLLVKRLMLTYMALFEGIYNNIGKDMYALYNRFHTYLVSNTSYKGGYLDPVYKSVSPYIEKGQNLYNLYLSSYIEKGKFYFSHYIYQIGIYDILYQKCCVQCIYHIFLYKYCYEILGYDILYQKVYLHYIYPSIYNNDGYIYRTGEYINHAIDHIIHQYIFKHNNDLQKAEFIPTKTEDRYLFILFFLLITSCCIIVLNRIVFGLLFGKKNKKTKIADKKSKKEKEEQKKKDEQKKKLLQNAQNNSQAHAKK